jgi:hypothetical protein
MQNVENLHCPCGGISLQLCSVSVNTFPSTVILCGSQISLQFGTSSILIHFILWRAMIPQLVLYMGYGLDSQSSISGRGKRFFCSPQNPYSLSGAHQASYPKGTGALSPGVKLLVTLTTLVLRSRMVDLHSPICLHGMVLN